jgi:hypothetical protein
MNNQVPQVNLGKSNEPRITTLAELRDRVRTARAPLGETGTPLPVDAGHGLGPKYCYGLRAAYDYVLALIGDEAATP